MKPVTLRWVESKLFVASDSNQYSFVIGRSPANPDAWAGAKPSDLLMLAAAACSAYDVVEILAKQREPLQDLTIYCTGEQLPEAPYTFTSMHLHYEVCGNIRPERLERAIRLSEDKYCSVITSLRPQVSITSDFEIRN